MPPTESESPPATRVTQGPDTPVSSTDAAGAAPARQGPLVGRWILESIDDTVFPGDQAYVQFMADGFINHSGGCGGSQPAFYTLDGQRITVTRREKPVVVKCPGGGYAARERVLNAFLDRASGWDKPLPGVLILSATDGAKARLVAESYPIPEIADEWSVVTLGGKPFGPAIVTFAAKGVSAHAECNTLYTEYTVGPDGVRVAPGGAATEIGCTPALHATDSVLFGAVGQVTGHRFGPNGTLVLTGGPGLTLHRAIDPVPLVAPR